MKKTLFCIAAVMLFLTPLAAQSITDVKIAYGTLCLKDHYSIDWNRSGGMPDTVSIQLRIMGSPDSAPPALIIHASANNNGHFDWVIPCSIESGFYFIRIATSNPAVYGDSDHFEIANCHPIQILFPQGSKNLFSGSNQDIWVSATCLTGTMRLVLLQNGKYMGSIASGLPASAEKYSWKVGQTGKADERQYASWWASARGAGRTSA